MTGPDHLAVPEHIDDPGGPADEQPDQRMPPPPPPQEPPPPPPPSAVATQPMRQVSATPRGWPLTRR